MNRPNFFCDLKTFEILANMKIDGDYQDIDLTVDLIEWPYLLIYTSDAETSTLKVLKRGDLYLHTETGGVEAGEITIDKKTNGGPAKSKDGDKLLNLIPGFWHACSNLSRFIQVHHLESLYQDMDPEEAGIRLSQINGEIVWKAVSGKERPDLMCSGLFGGTFMCRPYMEDCEERSDRENMSLTEKTDAAETGDIECMEELAMLYLNGDDNTSANPRKSFYWFHKMAEAGNSNGMFNTGLFYAKGFGITRDFAKASAWMEKALEAGDSDAEEPAELYKRMNRYLTAAEAGDAEAQAKAADTYMQMAGTLEQAGTDADYKESVKWAEKAAAQNNGYGCWILALAYEHGRGVKEDIHKAAELYEKGAAAGSPDCLNSLGNYYARGIVFRKDEQKAFELFQKAAEQGNGLAMRNLGNCYQFGTGVTGNMQKAVEWYEKSLEVNPDPELERKVQVFKMLGERDQSFAEDYETSDLQADDSQDFTPKTRFGRINELISMVCGMSIRPEELDSMSNLAPEIRKTMEENANQTSYDEKTRIVTFREIELTHTASKERVERIEKLHKGDKLKLRPDENGTYIVIDRTGAEIGNLWVNYAADMVIRNDDCEDVQVIVTNVIPKSQRGKGAKKSVVDVTLKLKLKEIDREGVRSIICFVGGDQTRTWYQKIEVVYSSLPVSVAEKLFEIYNRESNEYDQDHNDTGYIGLDNLKDEVIEAREKMRSGMISGQNYSKISETDQYSEFSEVVLKAATEEPKRYGILNKYFGSEISGYGGQSFRDLIEGTIIDEEDFFWIDQTHVTRDEYEANADGFNHWYDVAMLFKGSVLPIDLNDEDVVSVFGTGKFIALADLSYGC